MMLKDLKTKTELIKNSRSRADKKAIADTLSQVEKRLLSLEFMFTGLGPKVLDAIETKTGEDWEVPDVLEIFERASSHPSSNRKREILSEIVVDPSLKKYLMDILTNSLALNFKFEAGDPMLAAPMKPQLCSTKPFDLENSLIELKYDGIRVIAHKTEDEVLLFSRAGNLLAIEKIERELQHLPPGTILDGEVVGSDSADLQTFRRHTDDVTYKTFDCLMSDYTYIYNRPLIERREAIPKGLDVSEILEFDSMQEIVDFLKVSGVEGVVAKDPYAPYSVGKRDWQKFKLMKEASLEVVGFELGKGKRSGTVGSIVVSSPTISQTKVGSGFSDEDLEIMLHRLTTAMPTYVDVQYQSLTKDGKMRFPVFLKIRDDLRG